jgi:hypothetical protein
MLHPVGGGVYPRREQEKEKDTYRTRTLGGLRRADTSHTAQTATTQKYFNNHIVDICYAKKARRTEKEIVSMGWSFHVESSRPRGNHQSNQELSPLGRTRTSDQEGGWCKRKISDTRDAGDKSLVP